MDERGENKTMEIMQMIAKKEVYSTYQPIVDPLKNKIIGQEALARGYSNIMPIEMFQEAEKCGMTRYLDTLCLFTAIKNNPSSQPLFLNVLPLTLVWLIVSNEIEKLVKKTKGQIVFELIETERISSNLNDFIAYVKKAKNLGFKIAIDDISQGFSRLSIIPAICPDFLKIDRVLTSNGTKIYNSVIESIINIGCNVGAKIIAEGVETEAEYKNLLKLGINYYQGHYFAKPGEKYKG